MSAMRELARAVLIALPESDLDQGKPGSIKVAFAGGVAVVELPAPGELILVKTVCQKARPNPAPAAAAGRRAQLNPQRAAYLPAVREALRHWTRHSMRRARRRGY